MLRKPERDNSKKPESDSRFFKDIESLSKALALHPPKPQTRRLSLPHPTQPKPDQKPEPKPAWSWSRTLKSLSKIRHHRLDCTFTLHVSSISNLPALLSSSSFVLHWRRTSDPTGARTRPAKAHRGVAQFDETLACRCSVYFNGAHHKETVKYEPRNFLIYVTLVGTTGFDFGKFKVDLTRILPVEGVGVEEGVGEGEWSTSFRLTGKARGAVLNVSFGFGFQSGGGGGGGGGEDGGLQRVGSLRVGSKVIPSLDAKGINNEMELETVDSKLEREEIFAEKGDIEGGNEENEGDEPDFTVIEQGVEIEVQKVNEEEKGQERLLIRDTLGGDVDLELEEVKEGRLNNERMGMLTKSKSIYLDYLSESIVNEEEEVVGLEKTEERLLIRDTFREDLDLGLKEVEEVTLDSGNKRGMLMKSKSVCFDDDISESIANEFLSMLGLENSSEADPESPREKLWQEFEKDSLIVNDGIFVPEIEEEEMVENFDLPSILCSDDNESLPMNCKSRAQMLEDEETEKLMREMGLDEKVFESSLPPEVNGGFGSPIHIPEEEEPPMELPPPLGENLGSFLQTKDGGFLRSMSPSLFTGSKNSGNLVMQASSPVVVPAEMGSDVMEIMKGLASVGIEKLSMQASKLMPLEDINGKTMQEVAWDAKPSLESYERQYMFQQHLNLESESVGNKTRMGKKSRLESSRSEESSSEYVSLEDLAPLAMDKIEALSIEGLRIQSDMSNEEAPSNIVSQFIGNESTLKGEGAAGLKLLDVKDNGDDVDGLMGLSISLDEWIRLDSGIVDNEEDGVSERTTKVLAAHHAKSTEFHMADRRGKGSGRSRRWGLLGNNFTVALMVQLRDPMRDYEPVGMPMLALIQVERVFVPPKPKIYTPVFEAGNNDQNEDDDELDIKLKEDVIPQFKISEVHVTGLKTEVAEPSRTKLWGNQAEKQSGSRWLLANGMGKTNKHSMMKSNPAKKPVKPGDTMWSVSSRVTENGAKWKGLAALNPFRRNPNVIFTE